MRRGLLWCLAVCTVFGVIASAFGPVAAQQPSAVPRATVEGRLFPTPQAAVDALIAAVKADDLSALLAILGPGAESLLNSGDPNADREARRVFLQNYEQKHDLVGAGPNRMTLIVGQNEFPVPLPLVKQGNSWRYDMALGAQELIDRRIGRNEIAAIRVALAFVDAQRLYFEMTAASGGRGVYAERIVSRPGLRDGLYWPADTDAERSPLAPLVDRARDEGYPGELVSGRQVPYQGYYFRILKGQGPLARGGARDYVVGGRMTEGFALIASPARWGVSGVMTFVVNHDGTVFQKNLGPQTEALAAGMRLFNPGLDWARVDITSN